MVKVVNSVKYQVHWVLLTIDGVHQIPVQVLEQPDHHRRIDIWDWFKPAHKQAGVDCNMLHECKHS